MDKLWEFVNEKQAISANKPSNNDLLSSRMSSKAPPLAISTKDSKSQDITSLTISDEYTGGVGNNTVAKSEQHLRLVTQRLSHSPI